VIVPDYKGTVGALNAVV